MTAVFLALIWLVSIYVDSSVGSDDLSSELSRRERRSPPTFARAIAVFVDEAPKFLTEVRGLHASWLHSQSRLPIDLLLFHVRGRTFPSTMNCRVFAGSINREHSDCFLIEQRDASPFRHNETIASMYAFIRSIDFLLSEEAAFVEQYDYLMKSDCDTFVTPGLVG